MSGVVQNPLKDMVEQTRGFNAMENMALQIATQIRSGAKVLGEAVRTFLSLLQELGWDDSRILEETGKSREELEKMAK